MSCQQFEVKDPERSVPGEEDDSEREKGSSAWCVEFLLEKWARRLAEDDLSIVTGPELTEVRSTLTERRGADSTTAGTGGEEVQGGLLTQLLVGQEMTLEEVYANMTELLLAGVDTTSFTLSWCTYLLARYPAIQRSVYEEILRNLGQDKTPMAQDLSKLPLVRCVLKETLRMFPVLPGNGRITQEDMVVGGYFIPSGTQLALCHYSTSHNGEVFKSPGEFLPHRWLRKANTDRVDNFAAIPFGYGVRSCVGRRIAELQIQLALTQLLQTFEIQVAPNTGTVLAKTRGLLSPSKPIHLKFVDRK